MKFCRRKTKYPRWSRRSWPWRRSWPTWCGTRPSSTCRWPRPSPSSPTPWLTSPWSDGRCCSRQVRSNRWTIIPLSNYKNNLFWDYTLFTGESDLQAAEGAGGASLPGPQEGRRGARDQVCARGDGGGRHGGGFLHTKRSCASEGLSRENCPLPQEPTEPSWATK